MEDELLNVELWRAITIAFLSGTVIGLERQYRGKPAGVRTATLISIGTMLFVYMGSHIEGDSVDGGRVLGQVVTGIGFIGAGVMFNHKGVVNGVTTAAVVWILAAIGSMAGLGYLYMPLIITLLTVTVLSTCTLLEKNFSFLRRGDYGEK